MTDLAAHIARQQALWPLARELGRAVARGLLPMETALSYLDFQHPDCPVGLSARAAIVLHDTARDTERALAQQEALVRWRVKPLCKQRKSGHEIMQAARSVGGPMRDRELSALCVEVIHATLR
jgi:hypothetical protein